MTVFQKVIEGLLPGTRSLRPPLISGLLWAIFFWLLFSQHIPMPGKSSGLAEQAYAALAALGPIPSIAVLSILVFVLGAALLGVSDPLAQRIGTIFFRMINWTLWVQHSRRTLSSLEIQAGIERAKLSNAQLAADNSGNVEPKVANSIKMHTERIRVLQDKIKTVKNNMRFRFYPQRIDRVVKILGDTPSKKDAGAEQSLIGLSRWEGREAMMESSSSFFYENEFEGYFYNDQDDLVAAFKEELHPDPLDVLRDRHEPLFLEFDRLRAEREVRLAFSMPLLAILALAGVRLDSLWMGLATIIPISLIARYAWENDQERPRVIRMLGLHKIQTPALKRAYELGRRDVKALIENREREPENRYLSNSKLK